MLRDLASVLVGCAVIALAGPAGGVGSFSAGPHEPLEQRVALAIGPGRSVLWTQLRVDTLPGPLAIVAPAPEGARLDWASDAFFEALELATAPRVLPPGGLVAACPGEAPPSDPVIDTGDPDHAAPLTPLEVFIAQDAAELVTWAEAHAMIIAPAAAAALAATAGPFVAARFEAPDGEVLTPALRIASDATSTTLPLVLTAAGPVPLRVTSFVLAEGRIALDGPIVGVSTPSLAYDPAGGTSNYGELRMQALSSDAASWLLEASSRQAFLGGLAIEGTPHVVRGLVESYFLRAEIYEGGISAAACVSQAEAALAAPAPIAQSCVRGDVGTVGISTACSESPLPGQVDPSALRCGGDSTSTVADDLAVALAGQTATEIWLTRASLRVGAHELGSSQLVSPSPTGPVHPVLEAGKLDLSDCESSSSAATTSSSAVGSGGASSGGASAGAGGGRRVPVYAVDSGCGAPAIGALLYYVEVEDEESPDAYYQEEEGCSGDSSETYAVYETADEGYYEGEDDCGGDSSESYYEGEDDCGGDSSESYYEGEDDCGGDSSDGYEGEEDCSGDSSEGYEGEEDCSGDSGEGYDGGDDCGDDTSSTSEGCSIGRRRGRPRLSPIVLGALFLVLPVRRLTRPSRPATRACGRGRSPRGGRRG